MKQRWGSGRHTQWRDTQSDRVLPINHQNQRARVEVESSCGVANVR